MQIRPVFRGVKIPLHVSPNKRGRSQHAMRLKILEEYRAMQSAHSFDRSTITIATSPTGRSLLQGSNQDKNVTDALLGATPIHQEQVTWRGAPGNRPGQIPAAIEPVLLTRDSRLYPHLEAESEILPQFNNPQRRGCVRPVVVPTDKPVAFSCFVPVAFEVVRSELKLNADSLLCVADFLVRDAIRKSSTNFLNPHT